MAKCPVCRGKGYRLRIDDMRFAMAEIVKCESCDGKGVVEPLTEQEWLHTLNTEQLAEWIYQERWTHSDGWYEQCGHTVKEVVDWLKKPHREE